MNIYTENYKEIDYENYCLKCKFKDRTGDQIPCTYCMDEDVKLGSKIPTKFEEK